jgi:tetratricopeptide (TPR) repeat protein
MYDASIACYNKAIELHPKDSLPLVAKAIALVNMKKFDDAITTCEKAIDMNPNSSEAWSVKGFAYGSMKKKDFVTALKCYSRALQLDPNYHVARQSKRNILYSARQLGVKLCWRCSQRIHKGLEPLPYWSFDDLVCEQCYEAAENNTKFFKVSYIEQKNAERKSSLMLEGILMAYSLDGINRVVFEPNEKTLAPLIIDYVISINSADMNAISKFDSSVGSDKAVKCLLIEYETDEIADSVIFCTKEDTSDFITLMNSFVSRMLEQKSLNNNQNSPTPAFSTSDHEPLSEIRANDRVQNRLICINCGSANSLTFKFCSRCGNKLSK